LEDVIECGFDRLLTSGGEGTAIDNIEVLKKLFKQAGRRIIIIPGGGVRAQNMMAIMEATKCKEIHSAATHATRRRISLDEVKAMKTILS
jgi:copper homeostasis protein